MSNPELTGWISGDRKPVRDGVYLRSYSNPSFPDGVYCKFDNGQWGVGYFSLEKAACSQNTKSPNQSLPWRGLAKEPK
jgi:hypothetical protein